MLANPVTLCISKAVFFTKETVAFHEVDSSLPLNRFVYLALNPLSFYEVDSEPL